MRIVFLMNVVSPHMMPLASALAHLCRTENFRYLAVGHITEQRQKLGWPTTIDEPWIRVKSPKMAYSDFLAENGVVDADALFLGLRDMDILEKREKLGRLSIFVSERWAKPPVGMLRLLKPSFLLMVLRFRRLLRKGKNTYYFPIGIHAYRDMIRFCGNVIKTKSNMWGYFVSPSTETKFSAVRTLQMPKRVMWAGRFIKLKHVDDIVQAVVKAEGDSPGRIVLDLYGNGPELDNVKNFSSAYSCVRFHDALPIKSVRAVMRKHDVYVLASNGYEGWGAVVSEALEEGLVVLGTFEAGSSATILPKGRLFHTGDVERLAQLLREDFEPEGIGEWSAHCGARRLLKFIDERLSRVG